MKINLFFIAFILFFFNTNAQNTEDSVKWLSFDEVRANFDEIQKPVMIFLYSEESDSSRIMQETTFCNTEVTNYINIFFYPVKLNIYSTDTITFFDGQKYINSEQSGKKHDLCFMFTGQTHNFPALVLFDKTAKGQTFYGYKNRDQIFRELIYFAEYIGESVLFDDWLKYHKKAFPPGQKQTMTRLNVKWLPMQEALELQKTNPKKILLNFYNYRIVSGTVMRTQIFNQPNIADYINKHYYPINIDVFTKDTLEIFGQKYINENKPHKFHQLPIMALGGYMKFPAFLILDEENKVREKFHTFLTVEQLEPILKYYGDNAYKKDSWVDFMKLYNRN